MELEILIREIVAKAIGIPSESVENSSNLRDLGSDDLDILKMIELIDTTFKISINMEMFDNMKTVQDIINNVIPLVTK